MFFIQGIHSLPHAQRFRRGAVTTLLVVVLVCAFVILPFGVTVVHKCFDWLRIRRAHQYVQQVLPAACTGLSQTDLAVGRAKIQTVTTRQMMAAFFLENCPPVLQGHLTLQQIRFTTRMLEPDEEHWMGDRQPRSQPIVILQAALQLSDGHTVCIMHAVELFLD